MTKQIEMQVRPKSADSANKWVSERATTDIKTSTRTKRLTIDINEDLHRELKIHCVTNDVEIATHVRGLISNSLRMD
jgi:hypothetical protein